MHVDSFPGSASRRGFFPKVLQVSQRPLLAIVLVAALGVHGASAQAGSSTRADIPPSQAATPPPIPPQLNVHFTGHWTGLLESRAPGAAAADAPHTRVPARLVMRPSPDGRAINFAFTYRDSAGASTHERMILSFTDHTALLTGTVQVQNLVFKVHGLDAFEPTGYGTLTLTGQGMEDGKPVDLRETLLLQPGELTWTMQARPAGSNGAFAFRSEYLFTRDATQPGSPLP